MTATSLTCQQLVELVTDYLEGALPPAVRERFEAHLALCPGCVTYVEQMRQTIRAIGILSADTLSEETKSELLALFHNWRDA